MRRLTTVLVLSLTGCVSANIPLDQAAYPPADHVYAEQYLSAAENTEKITVVRGDGTFIGAGMKYGIWIDGNEVVSLNPGEKADLYLASGEHILSVGTHNLRAVTVADASVKLDIPTSIRIYRISTDGTSQIKLNPAVN